MLRVSYDQSVRRAVCSWDQDDVNAEWTRLFRHTLADHSPDIKAESLLEISVPWYSFLSARNQIAQILAFFKVELEASTEATSLLKQASSIDVSYQRARETEPIPGETLDEQLKSVGFSRRLTEEQARNICRLANLSAAATFSVPGAGKTTEALAYFFFRAQPGDRLLVVAPKNALGAWDEQLEECTGIVNQFVRLRGGAERVAELLNENPRFSIITYQQLNTALEIIAPHIATKRTFLFLDESHRIKGGRQVRTGETVLSLSYLPVGKLVLSGTPMPQSFSDLVPQFMFLYPEIEARPENVVELIQPIYVRTTKAELGLPPVHRRLISVPMRETQSVVYNLMRFEVARQAEEALGIRGKAQFRRLGRSIMRLLAFVSNPSLLAKEIDGITGKYFDALLAESSAGPKVDYACNRARELAKQGQKTLIWTSFVENVETLAERLSDLGAVYIHGGVDSGDEDDSDTREGKIRLFHDSSDVQVMIANPAAASEGISLHKVCRHAIYVDRTYNAAHYLQSEDRIHRLGLKPGESPTIEILECPGTIDESVRHRLILKVDRMAQALNDHSLTIDPIPFDPAVTEEDEESVLGINDDDLRHLISNLKGATA